MRSRALRVTLTLLAVVGIGAAAWFCWILQTRITAIDTRTAAFAQARVAAVQRAGELQAAQQAYVAAGQNETFWFERATAAAAALQAATAGMEAAATSADATAAIGEVKTALQEFEDRDRRVRSYAAAGQKLLAADVIFSDGLEASARIHTAIDRAAASAADERAAERQALVREQALAAGGAAGGAILVMLLLMSPGSTKRDALVPAVPESPAPARGGLDLRPAPRAAAAKAAPAPAPVAAPAAAAPVPGLELAALARVCADLARLDDTSAMPSILERMAGALDAHGLVLWVADAERSALTPIAAHGYPAHVLSRMGTLPVNAENATAAAFRTGLLQTVSADGETNGAIAAPLVSPAGCLGVMSAEVRHDGEKQPDRLAAAMIVAAQLATIIGPPAARAEDRNTAAI
jgi:hypothetical protein